MTAAPALTLQSTLTLNNGIPMPVLDSFHEDYRSTWDPTSVP